ECFESIAEGGVMLAAWASGPRVAVVCVCASIIFCAKSLIAWLLERSSAILDDSTSNMSDCAASATNFAVASSTAAGEPAGVAGVAAALGVATGSVVVLGEQAETARARAAVLRARLMRTNFLHGTGAPRRPKRSCRQNANVGEPFRKTNMR